MRRLSTKAVFPLWRPSSLVISKTADRPEDRYRRFGDLGRMSALPYVNAPGRSPQVRGGGLLPSSDVPDRRHAPGATMSADRRQVLVAGAPAGGGTGSADRATPRAASPVGPPAPPSLAPRRLLGRQRFFLFVLRRPVARVLVLGEPPQYCPVGSRTPAMSRPWGASRFVTSASASSPSATLPRPLRPLASVVRPSGILRLRDALLFSTDRLGRDQPCRSF